jgi:uncharacterized iron-regulated membrane protein
MGASLRRLHLWLGLTIGAAFAVLGLTGFALVFYVEVDRLTHPALHIAPRQVDWDQAVVTLRAAFPNLKGTWRRWRLRQPKKIMQA